VKPTLTRPAIIGGIVGGVLSALPFVAGGNLCCCLWVVSGGLVAAYLLQQNQPEPITPGDGALVGLLAGVAGAAVYLVVSIPINLMLAPIEQQVLQRLTETMGNMPPEFQAYARSTMAGSARSIIGFMFMLCVGAVFSTLGGLLGALIFAKKPSPAAVLPPGMPPPGNPPGA
jgi:hypothetical protein